MGGLDAGPGRSCGLEAPDVAVGLARLPRVIGIAAHQERLSVSHARERGFSAGGGPVASGIGLDPASPERLPGREAVGLDALGRAAAAGAAAAFADVVFAGGGEDALATPARAAPDPAAPFFFFFFFFALGRFGAALPSAPAPAPAAGDALLAALASFVLRLFSVCRVFRAWPLVNGTDSVPVTVWPVAAAAPSATASLSA